MEILAFWLGALVLAVIVFLYNDCVKASEHNLNKNIYPGVKEWWGKVYNQ